MLEHRAHTWNAAYFGTGSVGGQNTISAKFTWLIDFRPFPQPLSLTPQVGVWVIWREKNQHPLATKIILNESETLHEFSTKPHEVLTWPISEVHLGQIWLTQSRRCPLLFLSSMSPICICKHSSDRPAQIWGGPFGRLRERERERERESNPILRRLPFASASLPFYRVHLFHSILPSNKIDGQLAKMYKNGKTAAIFQDI